MISDITRVHKTFLSNQNNSYRIIGHWDSHVLYGKNGEQISAASINFHDATFWGIKSYQFVQEVAGECTLYVVPIEGAISEKQLIMIDMAVSSKLSSALKCVVVQKDEVILTERGKYQMIIQKCPK